MFYYIGVPSLYRVALSFPLWITFLFHKLLSFSVALYRKKKTESKDLIFLFSFFSFPSPQNKRAKDPIFLDNSLNYMYLSYTFSSIYGIIDYEKN